MEIKTILVRAYTQLNLGDDLFLKILFEKFPQTNFLLLAQYKKYKEWKYRYKNLTIINFHLTIIDRITFRIISFLNSENYLNKFILKKHRCIVLQKENIDAYVYIGGSLFQQFYKGGISGNDKFNQIMTSIFSDKPKYILGANFGPFLNTEYLEYYKSIFCQYTDICFRDHYSYSLFRGFSNIRCEKDIVFCLNFPKIEKEQQRIGFSLMDLSCFPTLYKYEKLYIKTIVELTYKFLAEEKTVYFFSFCKSGGDENVIKKILKKIPFSTRNKIKIIKYRGDIDSFLFEYMKIGSMFTTRFHAMILSLLANQRMYPFIYSDKITHVLNDLNYNGKYSKIDSIETVNNIIDGLNSNEYLLPISAIKKSAENQFKILENFITSQ